MAHKLIFAVSVLFISCISAQTLQCRTNSTRGGNAGGEGCAIPFVYKEGSFSQCTTVDYGDQYWCATTDNYDRDNRWGECICQVVETNTPAPAPPSDNPDGEQGNCTEKTADGGECSPTFIYSGETYSGCPTIDNGGRPWCSLSKDYDVDKEWANCAIPLKCETPQSGTGCREKTIFDTNCAKTFIYSGNSYTGCTTVNNGGVPWCSLTENYDADGQYANCAVPLTCVKPGGPEPGCIEKTYFGSDCAASFIYNGKTYTGCTTVNNRGTPWCSLTDNFDRDSQWARCDDPLKCSKAPGGEGCVEKTTSGGFCTMEYIYNGQNYIGCTTLNHNRAWCSLTDNFDRDGQYANCEVPLKCTSTNP